MVSASEKVIQLRQLMAERFGSERPPVEKEVFKTGFPALDEVGIPRAALTEIVAPVEAKSGGGLLLYGLLHTITQAGTRVILIDGQDSFDPKALPQSGLKRILWTRCHSATEAAKAADLAVRDGNIPLLILLLTLCSASELRRVQSTAWHRLQILAEKSAVTVLVFTPQSQVGCAQLRLSLSGAFPLTKLHRQRAKLLPSLHLQVERRRIGRERGSDDEDLRRPVCA